MALLPEKLSERCMSLGLLSWKKIRLSSEVLKKLTMFFQLNKKVHPQNDTYLNSPSKINYTNGYKIRINT